MGKDLRGKELGVDNNWLADAQFEDEHGNPLTGDNPTVDDGIGLKPKNGQLENRELRMKKEIYH